MSELHDDIQNLSAVLDLLQAGAHAAQQPVLRLVGDHLRQLARHMDAGPTPGQPPAPLPPCSPLAGAAPLMPEVRHVAQ